MNINKNVIFQLIFLAAFIVFTVPIFYLALYADNMFGAATYFFVYYVAVHLVKRYIKRKYAFDIFPKLQINRHNLNTLSIEGRIAIAVALGCFFAIIVAIVVREFSGLWELVGLSRTVAPVSDPYFWVLFAVLFVIGAILGDTLRKALQSTRLSF
ncbi:MAG: hypothetical protein FWH37_00065 [Candidatus Bathyarchaeota archaeon]|nr:hypothetical protein [Candidatus Termiticorpusculum sp.]